MQPCHHCAQALKDTDPHVDVEGAWYCSEACHAAGIGTCDGFERDANGQTCRERGHVPYKKAPDPKPTKPPKS